MTSGGHSHDLPGAGHRRPLAMVLGITASILVVEVIGAVVSGSLALLADAGHMLTDVAGLSLALVAAVLAGRPATEARTWGYRRAEVLAAAAQAAVLLAVGGFILVEAIRRLIEPSAIASGVSRGSGSTRAIILPAWTRRNVETTNVIHPVNVCQPPEATWGPHVSHAMPVAARRRATQRSGQRRTKSTSDEGATAGRAGAKAKTRAGVEGTGKIAE